MKNKLIKKEGFKILLTFGRFQENMNGKKGSSLKCVYILQLRWSKIRQNKGESCQLGENFWAENDKTRY